MIEDGHHLGLSGYRTDGEATADDLAEGYEIRLDTQEMAGAAVVDAKREHLVRDQQGAALPRPGPQCRHELGARRDQPERSRQRIQEHGRQIVAVLVDQIAADLDVVERQRHDILLKAFRHARFERCCRLFQVAPVLGARTVAGLCVVVDAVVAAFEFCNLAAAGCRACRPNGQQHALAPGVREPNLIDVRNAVYEQLGEANVGLGRQGEGRAIADHSSDRFGHRRVRVPEHQRGVVVDEVDSLLAFDIGDDAALPRGRVDRVRIHHQRMAAVAAGHDVEGALVERPRS